MKRVFLLPLILTLASCGASVTETVENEVPIGVETINSGGCEVSDAQITALREKFTKATELFQQNAKSQREYKREPLEHPFVEPPEVVLSFYENPNGLDYSWIIKVAEGCMKGGATFDNIQFEMTFRDDGRTTTNTAKINLKNKL